MTRILFVCHGNICRSPMAEFVMKDLVRKAGMENFFEIASAATSREELGNSVYPPAVRKLTEHGIDCSGKTSRQLQNKDYDRYDLLNRDGCRQRPRYAPHLRWRLCLQDIPPPGPYRPPGGYCGPMVHRELRADLE